jgi:uncharacterized protein (TIGR03086 family)
MVEMDPVELYRSATSGVVAMARRLTPEQLTWATPCADWSVQDVLDHLVDGTGYLASALGAAPSERTGPGTASGLEAGVSTCLDRMADPGNLAHRSTSPLGFEWSGAEATAGTFMDVLIHTWDLATATGQDTTLDPDLVQACTAMFLPDMPEAGRAGGIIGPAVEVPAGASPQAQLLGAMGRRP